MNIDDLEQSLINTIDACIDEEYIIGYDNSWVEMGNDSIVHAVVDGKEFYFKLTLRKID